MPEKVWQSIEWNISKGLEHRDFSFYQAYSLMKLVGKPLRLGQIYADYLMPQGYDSQEFKELGVRRMCKLIGVLGHSVRGEEHLNENWDKLCDCLK
jgi:hypothetical protein